MTLRRALVGCLSALVLIVSFIDGGFGFSNQVGTSGTHISAHLSPFTLAVWPFAIAAFVISWLETNYNESNISAKWPRILLAYFVDFALIFTSIVVPLCFISLLIEYTQVGDFSWHFSRTYSRPTDIVTIILSLVMFIPLFASISLFLLNDRKTPGCILTGITLTISEPIELWRCSIYGLFKYFQLALPILAFNSKTLGGFELTAQLDSEQNKASS